MSHSLVFDAAMVFEVGAHATQNILPDGMARFDATFWLVQPIPADAFPCLLYGVACSTLRDALMVPQWPFLVPPSMTLDTSLHIYVWKLHPLMLLLAAVRGRGH